MLSPKLAGIIFVSAADDAECAIREPAVSRRVRDCDPAMQEGAHLPSKTRGHLDDVRFIVALVRDQAGTHLPACQFNVQLQVFPTWNNADSLTRHL